MKLALRECAAAADELCAAEIRVADSTRETTTILQRAFDQSEDRERRKALSVALRQVRKGRVPNGVGDDLGELCRPLTSAITQLDSARNNFGRHFAAGSLATSHVIREIAADAKFREAVLMQNRAAIQRVLHAFSSTPVGKRGFKERQNEEMVASYLQRYCVKNDTIGFYGPVGWARLGADVPELSVSPGPSLVANSLIGFENWCVEALADKIAQDPSYRRWIPPRLLPEYRLDELTLRAGSDVTTLSAQQAAILKLCDGNRTARGIAASLMETGTAGNENEVYELLAQLKEKNVVSWAYDLPLLLHPEQRLRQLFDCIEDDELRQPALAALDKLESARNRVAAAFGNPDAVGAALNELERVFENVTGIHGSRLGGKMYAGRTLIYQDCRRDTKMDVGPAVLDAISPPLALVLSSARWFSHQVAAACRAGFLKAHTMMAHPRSGGGVELLRFLKYSQLLLFSNNAAMNVLTPVVDDLRSRWRLVLGTLPDTSRVEYASSQLSAQVDDVFAAPGPGWSLARQHSPDVMIAAANVDAIRRGDCYFVLGEVHVCANTLSSSLFVTQHSHPDDLCQAMSSDFPTARPILMFPRSFPRITNRSADAWVFPRDYYIEVSRDTIHAGERSQAFPVSAFLVKNKDKQIVVCTRDGRLEFDAVGFFAEMITRAALIAYDLAGLLSTGEHSPRVTIDKLVVARESWRFQASALAFIHEEDESLRFLQARRWMQRHRLPRFVFFKVAVEVKPFYLDFDSPIYVEILVKMIRRVLASDHEDRRVQISEMVPGHADLWLPDAEGNLYTSELRFVVKDLLG